MVIMLGGEAVADRNFGNIINDIALLHSLGVKIVLVHGARPQNKRTARPNKIATHRTTRMSVLLMSMHWAWRCKPLDNCNLRSLLDYR